jgi:hypothetical protein
LTGWTGGGDPLDTMELRFADRQAAEGYCRREGIPFDCGGFLSAPRCEPRVRGEPAPTLCCWPTGPHQLCCGAYPLAV